jgi:hypothetical protein
MARGWVFHPDHIRKFHPSTTLNDRFSRKRTGINDGEKTRDEDVMLDQAVAGTRVREIVWRRNNSTLSTFDFGGASCIRRFLQFAVEHPLVDRRHSHIWQGHVTCAASTISSRSSVGAEAICRQETWKRSVETLPPKPHRRGAWQPSVATRVQPSAARDAGSYEISSGLTEALRVRGSAVLNGWFRRRRQAVRLTRCRGDPEWHRALRHPSADE